MTIPLKIRRDSFIPHDIGIYGAHIHAHIHNLLIILFTYTNACYFWGGRLSAGKCTNSQYSATD